MSGHVVPTGGTPCPAIARTTTFGDSPEPRSISCRKAPCPARAESAACAILFLTSSTVSAPASAAAASRRADSSDTRWRSVSVSRRSRSVSTPTPPTATSAASTKAALETMLKCSSERSRPSRAAPSVASSNERLPIVRMSESAGVSSVSSAAANWARNSPLLIDAS